MSPRKKSAPDARPPYMISFDPNHEYTDGEVAILSNNQKRKYLRHLSSLSAEYAGASTQGRVDTEEGVGDENAGARAKEPVEENIEAGGVEQVGDTMDVVSHLREGFG